jgi:hypothetical protein
MGDTDSDVEKRSLPMRTRAPSTPRCRRRPGRSAVAVLPRNRAAARPPIRGGVTSAAHDGRVVIDVAPKHGGTVSPHFRATLTPATAAVRWLRCLWHRVSERRLEPLRAPDDRRPSPLHTPPVARGFGFRLRRRRAAGDVAALCRGLRRMKAVVGGHLCVACSWQAKGVAGARGLLGGF